MSGEVFKPKRIILKGRIKEQVMPGTDGAVNEQTEQEALTGSFTRTLYADPPGAFIFVCACGWKRRVIYSETNFRCERGGPGSTECDILWMRKMRPTGEVNADGKEVMEDDTVLEEVELVEEFSGKRVKTKVPRPQFVGRKIGELRAEEFRARKARGEEPVANPSNVAITTKIESAKQQFESKKASRAKETEGQE